MPTDTRTPDSKKPAFSGLFKLKGRERLIYTVEDQRLIVQAVRVGHRHEVYR